MDQRLIDALRACPGGPPERSVKLMSHVLAAHHIWNARIEGHTPRLGVWEPLVPDAWHSVHAENITTSERILGDHDLDGKVRYTNSKGETFVNSVQEILLHVVNHSTHHRAQIASDLREHGHEVPVMDYIFHKR